MGSSEIEAALVRRVGMLPEKREALAAVNKAFSQWWGRCPGCRAKIVGTLEELSKPCRECDGSR